MRVAGRRRLLRSTLVLCWVVAAGVSGCDGSRESDRAPGTAANEYFPLVPGAHWRYKLALEIGTGEIEVVARGDSAVDGLAGPRLHHGRARARRGRARHRRGRPHGLRRARRLPVPLHRARLPLAHAAAHAGRRRPRPRDAARRPRAGAEWTNDTRLLQQPENGGGGLIKWTGRTKQVAVVVVPAGSFNDVLLVETEYWDPSVNPDAPLLSYHDYYARGIGLLRSVTKNVRDGGTQMAEQTLLDFDFPEGTRAESVMGARKSAGTFRGSSGILGDAARMQAASKGGRMAKRVGLVRSRVVRVIRRCRAGAGVRARAPRARIGGRRISSCTARRTRTCISTRRVSRKTSRWISG